MRLLILTMIAGLGLMLSLHATRALAASPPSQAARLARGRYLTRLSDCKACHTQPGHAAFAGGRPISTPFGVLYTPNITPDKATGIGNWSMQDFYLAMHNGIGSQGQYLYPAFPYPAYTKLSRQDVRAIWTYLLHVKPVRQRTKNHALHWPYSRRNTLWLWRLLYFDPGAFKPNLKHSKRLNRGAYLVKGLTHCGACHTPRNSWGAKVKSKALSGGTVAIDDWLAPNITPHQHTGIGRWSPDALQRFLKTGRSANGDALGPMRDVVQSSLQYLNHRDLNAIVAYLKSVPARQSGPIPAALKRTAFTANNNQSRLPGKALYRKHCADCHGKRGQARRAVYPDLLNDSLALEQDPTNLILIMLRGGFQASTKTYPYPFSMPPFGVRLSDPEIAAIANYVRRNWHRRTPLPVSPRQVNALR